MIYLVNNRISIAGWWFEPLWNMMEFVSWDDEIPNWMESHKIHVPNHQPDILLFQLINHYEP